MAYDSTTAETLRRAVADLKFEPSEEITERNMFGGVCVLLNGSMLAGVTGSLLVVRLSDQELETALTLPYVRPMDFTGRPMKNFAYIDPEGLAIRNELVDWIEKSLKFVRARQVAKTERSGKRRK